MIEQTVIEGIPTLIASGSGPLRGGISFRVGHADETLGRSGITHLIEHLALFRHGLADYHYNGATAPTVTHFYSQGAMEDVGTYINDVCAALADLPFDRLETEKQILRTEADSRSRSVLQPMSLWRHGARGYGLAAYPEWGLPMLTPDDLRAWVARYFTRENAVMWFSGPPPVNLRPVLGAGRRMPLPAVTSALPTTPAFFTGPPKSLGMHSLVERTPSAQIFASVLERELFRSLRQEGGYSYTVATDYEPIDGQTATVLAVADAHPDKQDAALGAFIDVLAKLRVGNIDQADIDATLNKAAESLGHPDYDAARLPSCAVNVLTDQPVLSSKQIGDRLAAVTVADVHRVALAATADTLLMVPSTADWAGYTAAPTTSDGPTPNPTRYPMINNSGTALLLGPQGASIEDNGDFLTVAFGQCAAMLVWPDGGRVLIGADGITCRVEPTLYGLQPAALAGLDAVVPQQALVRMPARPSDSIPKPRPSNAVGSAPNTWLDNRSISSANPAAGPSGAAGQQPTQPTEGAGRRTRILAIVLLVVLSPVVLFCGLTSVIGTVDETTGQTHYGWFAIGLMWFLTVVPVLLLVGSIRTLLRRRRAVSAPAPAAAVPSQAHPGKVASS